MNWKSVGSVAGVALALVVACGGPTQINTGDGGGGGTNCGTGSTLCGDTCTVVARDPQNCGGCGKPCAMGEVCSQGACASACGGGTTKCGPECVDTKSDGRNCGMCGTKCTAQQVCNMGACSG